MAVTKFKTIDELLGWVKENTVTFDDGGISIKEMVDLDASFEKKSADYGLGIKENIKFKKRAQEAEAELQKLQGQLASVNNELESLKSLDLGKEKEALQKLNKEKSDLVTKLNSVESINRELQKKAEVIPALEKQVSDYKVQSNRTKILDAVRKSAIALKVPNYVIDNDFDRLVVPDFDIDESGNILSKGDVPQSVENYIVARQKTSPHWQPESSGSGASPPGGAKTAAPLSVGQLFRQSTSS
jgi:hypothetical protein